MLPPDGAYCPGRCSCRILRADGTTAWRSHFVEPGAAIAALAQLINELHWCERYGIYFDLFGRGTDVTYKHNFLNHKTVAAFWALLGGVASTSQANRLAGHLVDPDEFWTPHPLPALSRDDPNYDPFGGYWLGSVWPPTNYMVVRGLQQYGRHDLAREIAVRHLTAMYKVMEGETYRSIWECYSPEYIRPATNKAGELVRPNFVGWSGLGPLAMLIEQILGFEFDASGNTVCWTIATPGRHGLENVQFNGGRLSLICKEASLESYARDVIVETKRPLALDLRIMGRGPRMHHLSSGRHRLQAVGH